MRKLIAIALVMALLLSLVACSNKTIGKISGPENDCITIDDVKYNRETNHDFSNADKGKYLGRRTEVAEKDCGKIRLPEESKTAERTKIKNA